MAVGGVERVDAAARIGHVHRAVDDHRRRLIADAVDDAVLEQPARRQRGDVRGVDLIHRREPAAGEIEIVQRPVDRLRGQRHTGKHDERRTDNGERRTKNNARFGHGPGGRDYNAPHASDHRAPYAPCPRRPKLSAALPAARHGRADRQRARPGLGRVVAESHRRPRHPPPPLRHDRPLLLGGRSPDHAARRRGAQHQHQGRADSVAVERHHPHGGRDQRRSASRGDDRVEGRWAVEQDGEAGRRARCSPEPRCRCSTTSA